MNDRPDPPRPIRNALPRHGLAFALFSLAGISIVLACGMDFPTQLLDDREGTLKATPPTSFAYAASHLVVPGDSLRATRSAPAPLRSPEDDATPPEPGMEALSPLQQNRVATMRDAIDGDAAYARADGLPAAIRLYTAAAVDTDLARRTGAPDAAERARRRFQAVLDLPDGQGRDRAVWAAAMLGRLDLDRLFASGDGKARDDASRAFAQARALARQGAPDPLSLAVASYGEQARSYLMDGGTACGWKAFLTDAPCADRIAPANLDQAIALYAQQAARGSNSGVTSLQLIASWAMKDSRRARRLIDDPLGQQLLVAYALARTGDIVNDDPRTASVYAAPDRGGQGYYDAARGISGNSCPYCTAIRTIRPNPAIVTLVDAIRARGVARIAHADRLAALAYRGGRADLARTFASMQPTPLSHWVLAKLAIQQGDLTAAARQYAEAVKGFPTIGDGLAPREISRLRAEQGVLTLSRGQYVAAFDCLYAAADADSHGGIAFDAAYLAERVLTIDELRRDVDTHIPAARTAESDKIRSILARRLVRAGRVADALPYFPDDRDQRAPIRAWARTYGQALHDAAHRWTAVGRAQAWFTAANLAHAHGMDIMGTEQDPDYAVFDGGFAMGAGRTLADGQAPLPTTRAARAAIALPGPLVTEGERARFAASEATPYRRFHYRAIAVDQAENAADLLPPRSQAFAAVLCQAAGWGTGARAELYHRYVRQGPSVPFAKDFGRHCAAPDFRSAAMDPYARPFARLHRWLHHHLVTPLADVMARL
ncbi:tetratricopeptide repeat family protein 3 [Gluconacetobacter sacchari DSM 12717]|uniref:Uncharacterized protein n=2 Tax=Gluconacetobacter sacchari TaxID=92759 RepID=A0A7W4IGG2_9PROT|nr:hypothetical protein [Gluconacetobacter sacchari]MBB2162421.1 hypothetical protein [Gluconacetobacter sacchari]GBQ25211.1 tetratricopeptide repeat family protein 3 [Gluconacetobacter sacchari DSM 12717]